jgi:secreted trypsin-like serine protease
VTDAADPLQEQTELADRLARLVAPDDDRRSLLAFAAVMNVLDGFRSGADDEDRHARSLLMRGLGGPIGASSSGRHSALSPLPGPPADSVYSDAVFQANARKLFHDRHRIVGGVATGEFPDCVAVGDAQGWCCTGTLLAPRVVVTAAHCARDGCSDRVLVGSDVADPDATVLGVQAARLHPDYGGVDDFHDLCVLILEAPAGAAPRALASVADVDAAESTRVVGFGNVDEFGSAGYGRRRMVDVPMASSDPRFGADPTTEFVAGAPWLDRDSCTGDSGGPAYIEVEGEWRLAGATSRRTASAFRRCGDGGIYTNVAAFDGWIREVTGGLWN